MIGLKKLIPSETQDNTPQAMSAIKAIGHTADITSGTTTKAWTDVDVTPYTSATADGIFLNILITVTVGLNTYVIIKVRKKGDTSGYQEYAAVLKGIGYYEGTLLVGLDGDGVFQIQVSKVGLPTFAYDVFTAGYTEPLVAHKHSI